ncbi:MAG: hypothetical protein KDI31_10475 [Pseudomonadales bacterium]|nr:hypothetical protein [Pseudomonadales bacterium]
MSRICWWLTLLGLGTTAQTAELSLPLLNCIAEQTGGFHDYPENEELYEPALFHPRAFELEENLVFKRNLVDPAQSKDRELPADLYVTLRMLGGGSDAGMDAPETELECRQVRGADGSQGVSCVNLPPSELLLLNMATLRFTRASVGGWTFTGARDAHGGDSIYVEYGRCRSHSDSDASGG